MIEAAKLEADIYPAGPRGLSAYEIYKKEGGQLSEEEWLKSLNGLTPTIGENGNWFLGTVDTGLPSRGPKGDTGSIKFIVVTELPTENIDETAIYLKPVESPTGENKFEELIYVNGKWESLGTPNVAVDLSNYYTKTETDAITGNLENLTTEDKSNLVNAINEVASSSGSNNALYISGKQILNSQNVELKNYKDDLTNLINNNINKHIIIFVHDTSTNELLVSTLIFPNEIRSYYDLYLYFGGISIKQDNNICDSKIRKIIVVVDYDVESGLYTVKDFDLSGYKELVLTNEVLTKTNTMSYTPTANYHPATKKYVDDQVGNINTVLATLTTVSEVTK